MRDLAFAESFGDSDSFARPRPQNQYDAYGKRGFDILLALLLLPACVPIIALLWALVKCNGGPGFFGHTRIGRNEKPFTCWKIRTMVVGAEEQLALHLSKNPQATAEWAYRCKLTGDPRVTRLGACLRSTSLDELPQIWNVLKGDMSFVGPRPIVRSELARYGSRQWVYLAGRPGITGIWQVSGRRSTSYDERVMMDAEYLARASLLFDALMILKTIGAMVRQTGL